MSRKPCAGNCRPSVSAGAAITVQVQRCCMCAKPGVLSRQELCDESSSCSPDDPRETVFYCEKHYKARMKELTGH